MTGFRAKAYYTLAFLLPFIITLLIFFLLGQSSLPGFSINNQSIIEIIPVIVVILAGSIAEEIGWRGFLLPALSGKFSPVIASIIVGLVWGIWHFKIDSGVGVFII